MKILMTRQELPKVITNAINASIPGGSYDVDEILDAISRPARRYDDIQISHNGTLNVDNFDGHPVRLFIQRQRGKTLEEDVFSVYDDDAEDGYHMWSQRYKSHLELVKSVNPDPTIVEDEWILEVKEDSI